MQKAGSHLLEVLLIVEVVSCSRAPERELIATEQAIAQARAAEADVYAPEDFQQAKDQLANARRQIEAESEKSVLTRSYEDARGLLASATLAAHRAVYEAGDRRQEVQEDAQKMLRTAHRSWEVARSSVAKVVPGVRGSKVFEGFQRKLNMLEDVLKEARMDFEAGNYNEARDKADTVISEADSLEQDVARALQTST